VNGQIEALVAAVGLPTKPGTKGQGFLAVPGYSPELDVPVVVVRGRTPGPVAVVIAGVHGGEYNGIEAARRAADDLDATRVHGAVAIVPLANRAAFHARSHNGAPPDGQNLGRIFPGIESGTALERVAYVISSRLVRYADAVLDLHGADPMEDLVPQVYIPVRASNEQARPWTSWDLAEVYGIEFVEELASGRLGMSGAAAAAAWGIPAILTEAGAFGHLDEAAVRVHYDGIFNVLRRIGVLKGKPQPARRARRIHHERINSPMTGLFYSRVRAGDRVHRGQILGEITDYFGQNRTLVEAPAEGVVDFIKLSMATNEGNSMYFIAVDMDI
jgi:predicted deacylase